MLRGNPANIQFSNKSSLLGKTDSEDKVPRIDDKESDV
jgi:hypothetical protein